MFEAIVPLRRAIPYIQLYKRKTFVVKVGGNIVRRGDQLDQLASDLTLLHQVGIRIILVHGGGPQATELSRNLGLEPQIIAGRRVTDDQALEVAKMVYGGSLNLDILAALRAHGTSAVGISGVDGQLLTARRRDKKRVQAEPGKEPIEVDFGWVGEIEQVNAAFLDYLLDGQHMPVVSSLAADQKGQIFNVNADTIAQEIAIATGAEKLLLLTDTEGLLADREDPSSLVPYADVDQIDQMIHSGQILAGMLPKVEACRQALAGGVKRTHILSGTRPGALLVEVFTNAGCGTMIVGVNEREAYQQELAE